MPRQARIDYPGGLHHIIVRGLERKPIFLDKKDYEEILARLTKVFLNSSTKCYAWVLMPNHFHLLLVTGKVSLSRVMQSLLTGYALYFNKQYKRAGYLFQNRYKSILCERDAYFLELVRYIHLNPLRGGIIKNIDQLNDYRWCGHAALMEKKQYAWQDTEEVLGMFSINKNEAMQNYLQFLSDGVKQGKRNDLIGGGLIRSLGGWKEAIMTKKDERQLGDERILGSGEFVEAALKAAEEKENKQSLLIRKGWNTNKVLNYTADAVSIKVEDIIGNSKRPEISKARALACRLLTNDFGMKRIEVAKLLKISNAAVSKNIEKGKKIGENLGITLEKVKM